ncbi:MAG: SAM-dependent methyltransferase [Verrucomicrobiales bacterium]|nr:SAM-dependent methyltransferase [Verrucomicrobiales bacterium]
MPEATDFSQPLNRELQAAYGGVLPWRQVMELALYHPECGYYAGRPRRLGRSGDFYTAVSVGSLYGELLARQAAALWEAEDRPDSWWLAEQAAHDGQLMADVLAGLSQVCPDLRERVQVVLVEPQSGYQEAQAGQLSALDFPLERVHWLPDVAALPAGSGFFWANELLDALPVHRVIRWQGAWWEQGVTAAGEGWAWARLPITEPALQAELAALPTDAPDGWATEIPLAMRAWVEDLGRADFQGAVWIADYGLDAEDYWSLDRPDGTLRRYLAHRTDGQVLEALGQADLTAHVNFSRLRQWAEAAGLRVRFDQDQGRALTHLAEPWLRSLEGRPPDGATAARLRQFQSLTHPAHMGKKFRILLLDRPG